MPPTLLAVVERSRKYLIPALVLKCFMQSCFEQVHTLKFTAAYLKHGSPESHDLKDLRLQKTGDEYWVSLAAQSGEITQKLYILVDRTRCVAFPWVSNAKTVLDIVYLYRSSCYRTALCVGHRHD